ncbi:hypothetical protein [Rhizobium leguminosarum]|uniref:hypothetical protein n=1 Tax=Rhizobium leguminosarum TaxID=384 RepID=UPI0004AD3A81|nr:hypothetical protein [Rhizobium leguminosarum]
MYQYASDPERFEVDGSNAARDFPSSYDPPERDVDDVWDSIALQTTPGIPQNKRPTIAVVAFGVRELIEGDT